MPGATFAFIHPTHSKLRTPLLFPFPFCLHLGILQGKGREGGSGLRSLQSETVKSGLGEGVVRVGNGKARVEDARASVWGRGSEGKGGGSCEFLIFRCVVGNFSQINAFSVGSCLN